MVRKQKNISIFTKRLDNDIEHQLLFDIFFDKYSYKIDYSKIDYNRLYFLICKKHRIVNHFLENVNLEYFPDDFIAKIKKYRLIQKQNALKQLSILIEINKLLNEFDFIVLKGLVLSQQLYNDFSYRDSSDIDILIKPENEKDIISILQKNGYDKAYNYEHHFILKRKGFSIEIHRKLSAFFDTKRLEKDIWKSKLSYLKINDFDFKVIPNNILFNYYIVNSASHFYKRLQFFLDLQKMIDNNRKNDIDSNYLIAYNTFKNIIKNNIVDSFIIRTISDYLFVEQKITIVSILKRTIYFGMISNYSILKTFYKRTVFFVSNKLFPRYKY